MTDLPSQPPSQFRTIVFRAGLIYFLLYALPFPLQNLHSLLMQLWIQVGDLWNGEKPPPALPQWMIDVQAKLGIYASAWREFTSSLGTNESGHGWLPFEVMHQPTGSGDTAHAYVRMIASVVATALLTLLWTIIDQAPRHYRGLGRWLHLGVRWYTGMVILGYGLIKLYGSQFGDPSLSRLMQTFGDMSPMGLVWTFMAFSEPYEFISGVGEAMGGLLLLWRRTSLLGCLVLIPVMGNVVLLNWLYDVPVKLFSSHLLLFTVTLLCPEARRLYNLLWRNQQVEPLDHRLVARTGLRRLLVCCGSLWVVLHLLTASQGYISRAQARAAVLPEHYGVYEVESMSWDGKAVGRFAPRRWRWFAIDQRSMAWSRTAHGQRRNLYIATDEDGRSARVAPHEGYERIDGRMQAKVPENLATWTIEPGQKIVAELHPAPKTREETGVRLPAERLTLLLKGRLDGKELELRLVQRVFRLNRGFHWVQELPFNR